jgi:hypothetical protein
MTEPAAVTLIDQSAARTCTVAHAEPVECPVEQPVLDVLELGADPQPATKSAAAATSSAR